MGRILPSHSILRLRPADHSELGQLYALNILANLGCIARSSHNIPGDIAIAVTSISSGLAADTFSVNHMAVLTRLIEDINENASVSIILYLRTDYRLKGCVRASTEAIRGRGTSSC